jgi:hypothetical protein
MSAEAIGPVPQALRLHFDRIVALTDPVCAQHLSEEYAHLCRRLTAALCRKRPSPLLTGKIEVWACAIVYALGRVNFLFDKSQSPHLRADQLCELFSVGKNTAAAKAKLILDALNIGILDPRWCLPSKIDDNPMAWMITINGFIIDARYAPPDVQEEALRLGLIPYLPQKPAVAQGKERTC